MTDQRPKSGVAPGTALLIGIGGFIAGIAVMLGNAPSPAVAPAASAAPAPSTVATETLPEPVVEQADATALDANELAALTNPPPIGSRKLSSLSEVDWASYKSDFVARNPGLVELDGFAPLVSEEFARSDASLTADEAMRAAMQRAAKRWVELQTAAALDTYPALQRPQASPPEDAPALSAPDPAAAPPQPAASRAPDEPPAAN